MSAEKDEQVAAALAIVFPSHLTANKPAVVQIGYGWLSVLSFY